MSTTLDASGMHLFFGENVEGTSVGDDFVRLITNEIVEILKLHDNKIEGQIVNNLLENGRQSLLKYKDEIISKTYKEVMNGNDNKLMISLKKYFRQQWETQYGASNQWFISFLKQYENGENHDTYECVLIRTVEYGSMYMKDCPILSIVLQLLFESIDDDCLKETNVFDDLWFTITNDGLKSITKYSDYIVKSVMNEQLKSQSILFQALREYYRENVFSSLKQSNIVDRKNLYELALDNVAVHGWLTDMKPIEDNVSPKSYRMLLDKLHSFHKKQKPPQKEKSNVTQVRPTKVDLKRGPTLTDNDTKVKRKQGNLNLIDSFPKIFSLRILHATSSEMLWL
ncbi:unnamed protein product [Rotaria sp. Silwood2]|nr:unnamed protein product [Rotaria sp. Silwood2]CAF3028530.1 unnamed protein product [Rotaria sp. Silwood2]CAF3382928.1 unnamed protein product [Rotaria sp. Silwood2]CAF4268953.1 unnamed protein product [Rotaria sp. Silwood2]CAF4310755.1 unnamed protein product [Rotaria sp. Silwood2]